MQAQSGSMSGCLVGVDDSVPEGSPIRERLTEEVEPLVLLSQGA